MVDFSTPTLTTNKDNVLTYLRDAIASVAKADYSADTNYPTGSLRWNQTGNVGDWQRWNGAGWDTQKVTSLADSSVGTAQLAADAVTAPKLRLANNTYLRANNAAGTVQSLIGINTGNETVINGFGGAGIRLGVSGTTYFTVGNNSILPTSSGDLGSGSAPFANAYMTTGYCTTFKSHTVEGDSGANRDLYLSAPLSSSTLVLGQGGAHRIYMGSDTMRPAVNKGMQLGNSSTLFSSVWTNYVETPENYLFMSCALQLTFRTAGVERVALDYRGIWPGATSTYSLGLAGQRWNHGYFNYINDGDNPAITVFSQHVQSNNNLWLIATNFVALAGYGYTFMSITRGNWYDGTGLTDRHGWYGQDYICERTASYVATSAPVGWVRMSVDGKPGYIPVYRSVDSAGIWG